MEAEHGGEAWGRSMGVQYDQLLSSKEDLY